jgi:knotted carbamoyltransferase YgeW
MTDRIDAGALEALHGRSLLLTREWSRKDLDALLSVARRFAALDRAGQKVDWLRAELAYAIFFDNSTRTKSAWAGASTRLGMSPVIVDGSSTQVAHGETAEETGAMLGMNSHALGVRHDTILGAGNRFMRDVKKGIDGYLASSGQAREVPIVNLQCDIDHPTQTLADLLWLQERFPDGLEGKKIAMSWAYSPSYAKPLSVPQGIITLLTRFGAHVSLAHPEGYRLMDSELEAARSFASESGGSFEVVGSMDRAFEGAAAVYPKSWGPYDLMMERVSANEAGDAAALKDIERRALARNAQFESWICDEARMARTAGGDALYLHCLPADIGAEVTPGVMARHRVDVAREAQYKVYVIMSMLAVAKVRGLAARLAAA